VTRRGGEDYMVIKTTKDEGELTSMAKKKKMDRRIRLCAALIRRGGGRDEIKTRISETERAVGACR